VVDKKTAGYVRPSSGSVRSEPAAPAAVASPVASSSGETAAAPPSAVKPAAAATEPTPAASARHAGDVGALRVHLDVPSLEDAIVENEGRRDGVGFAEFNVCVTVPSLALVFVIVSGDGGGTQNAPLWLARELVE
jgi:hypothetical protein